MANLDMYALRFFFVAYFGEHRERLAGPQRCVKAHRQQRSQHDVRQLLANGVRDLREDDNTRYDRIAWEMPGNRRMIHRHDERPNPRRWPDWRGLIRLLALRKQFRQCRLRKLAVRIAWQLRHSQQGTRHEHRVDARAQCDPDLIRRQCRRYIERDQPPGGMRVVVRSGVAGRIRHEVNAVVDAGNFTDPLV